MDNTVTDENVEEYILDVCTKIDELKAHGIEKRNERAIARHIPCYIISVSILVLLLAITWFMLLCGIYTGQLAELLTVVIALLSCLALFSRIRLKMLGISL